MKKLIIAIVGIVTFCGCNPTTLEEDGSVKCVGNEFNTGRGIVSKTKIEGHEYLIFQHGYASDFCHSASCPCHTKEQGK